MASANGNYTYYNNPTETYTLEQFILMKTSDTMTYSNFSIYDKIGDLKVIDHNLIDDYVSELVQLSKIVQLSDEEWKKYRYFPDLLAYDVYGSVQLDFIVLAANDIIDPKDFNFKKLRLPMASVLAELLNEIYNSNSNYMAKNVQDLAVNTKSS